MSILGSVIVKPQRATKGPRTHINMTNRLRELRLECQNGQGLTQETIAEEIGIPRGTYATLESGVCLPTQEILEQLMHVLRCRDTEIYAGVYLDIIRMES